MKICNIYIKGFQQFEDTFLDFTHPETGEPLNKICFIGRNGTGKSTIVKIINDILTNSKETSVPLIILKFRLHNSYFYALYSNILYKNTASGFILKNSPIYYKEEVANIQNWIDLIQNPLDKVKIKNVIDSLKRYAYQGEELNQLLEIIRLKDNSSDLLII
ncbi:MAG TPA: AAA family ATPase [Saprospiraceae bacterium]|nr:AAA family ATPase [Saprospiraceae bacterium]